MSNFYLYMGCGSSKYFPIKIEGDSIKSIIYHANRYIRGHNIDLHAVISCFAIYLGKGYNSLHDERVMSLNFPKEFGQVKAWSTSPEMCGVDTTINKNVSRYQFYRYAMTLKHWKWELNSIPNQDSCRYGTDLTIEECKALMKFTEKYPSSYKDSEKHIVDVKSINYFDKCFNEFTKV